MINGERVVESEIDVYEQFHKYTVWYEGYLFFGDTDGYNEHEYDRWSDVQSLIDAYGDMIHVNDNEYGVTFSHGEWN